MTLISCRSSIGKVIPPYYIFRVWLNCSFARAEDLYINIAFNQLDTGFLNSKIMLN